MDSKGTGEGNMYLSHFDLFYDSCGWFGSIVHEEQDDIGRWKIMVIYDWYIGNNGCMQGKVIIR